MLLIYSEYDDNLYGMKKEECVGEVEYQTFEDAIKQFNKIIRVQDYFIEMHRCYNPYTMIKLIEDGKVLVAVKYKYRKGILPENNRKFKKEVKAINDYYYNQVERDF